MNKSPESRAEINGTDVAMIAASENLMLKRHLHDQMRDDNFQQHFDSNNEQTFVEEELQQQYENENAKHIFKNDVEMNAEQTDCIEEETDDDKNDEESKFLSTAATDCFITNTFTIEQMELIRRLRNTGITPQAILQAFQELDKVENDLDSLPVSGNDQGENSNNENVNKENNAKTIINDEKKTSLPHFLHQEYSSSQYRRASYTVGSKKAMGRMLSTRRATDNNLLLRLPASIDRNFEKDFLAIHKNNLSDNNDGALTALMQQFQQQLENNEQSGQNDSEQLKAFKMMVLLNQRLKLQQQQQQKQQEANSPRDSINSPSPPPAKKSSLLPISPCAALTIQANQIDILKGTTECALQANLVNPKLIFTTSIPSSNSSTMIVSNSNEIRDEYSHYMSDDANLHLQNDLITGMPSFMSDTISNATTQRPTFETSTSCAFSVPSSTGFNLSPYAHKRSASNSSTGTTFNNDAQTTNFITQTSSSFSYTGYKNFTSGTDASLYDIDINSCKNIGAGFLINTLYNSHNDINNSINNNDTTESKTLNNCDIVVATTSQDSMMNANSNGGRPIRSQRTPMKDITTLDDPNELEEFMRRGEEACINDMKQFITQFSLRQTTVAMMTGVSQPYISKLLNGNHRELSIRCRKNIYSWYLNCRRHPAKLALFTQDPSSRLETNVDGELIPQRRERYVFRPLLIRILEAYFSQSAFPDSAKRAEIAQACNQALQIDKKGVELMPKEIVTAQVIANWFANKRKENRRKSHDDTFNMHSNMGSSTHSGSMLFSLSSANNTPASLLTNSAVHNPPPSSAPSTFTFQLSSAAKVAAAAAVANAQAQAQKAIQSASNSFHTQQKFFDSINVSPLLVSTAAPISLHDSLIFPKSPIESSSVLNNDETHTDFIANFEAIRAVAAAAVAKNFNPSNISNIGEDKVDTTTISTIPMRSALDKFLDNPQQHLHFLRRSSCGVGLAQISSEKLCTQETLQSNETRDEIKSNVEKNFIDIDLTQSYKISSKLEPVETNVNEVQHTNEISCEQLNVSLATNDRESLSESDLAANTTISTFSPSISPSSEILSNSSYNLNFIVNTNNKEQHQDVDESQKVTAVSPLITAETNQVADFVPNRWKRDYHPLHVSHCIGSHSVVTQHNQTTQPSPTTHQSQRTLIAE